jgi:predicted  nucleic acid-binding Zn-ribbon protein
MRFLIIDQCSGSKDYPSEITAFEKDTIDEHSLDELLDRDDTLGIEAGELYAGRQQQKIDDAVQMLERNGHEITRYYVSAGFGLVYEHDPLPPYEVTFSEMSDAEIDARAEQLGIPDAVSDVLQAEAPYDVVYFALGSDYYRSVDLESTLEQVPDDSIAVVFNKEAVAAEFENVVSVPARTEEAKQFGTIVVALKGVYLKNLARELEADEEPSAEELVEYCVSEESSQTGFEEFS